MNLKTKAVALLAGTTLALSVATGAMAQDNTTVTLGDKSGGTCAASLSGTFNLGTWSWDGDEYQHDAGTGDGTLNAAITQDISSSDVDCTVTASGGPLTQRDGSGNVVSGGATIDLSFDVNNTTTNTANVSTSTGAGESVPVEVSMSDLTDQPAATYKGTVTVDASEAS